MKDNRFTPSKRIAIDGKTWWSIWDNKNDKWATFYGLTSCFKTRKDCKLHIDYTLKTHYSNDNKMLYCQQ